MLIQNLLKENNYIYSERYINQFKKVANEVSSEYCAIQGISSFKLPYIEFAVNNVDIFLARPDKIIFNKIIKNGNVKFFVHPEMISETKIDNFIKNINVEPTSSTRTVLPKGENFAIKLHLNKRLSRYIRRLKNDSIKHSVAVSLDLERSIDKCPDSFAYLPESIGVVYDNFGYIIREMNPRPIVNENRKLIPLFSFYSKDINNDFEEPLFVQLVKLKNVEPMEFFLEKILRPLFININYFLNERGILLEPHGQNVLVEVDKNFNIKRLVHRDFQSIYINKEIRINKSLPDVFNKHIMNEECPKEICYSLVYDQFIGEYLIDNFVELISTVYKIDKKLIESKIKNIFLEYFNKQDFPDGYYYVLSKEKFIDNNSVFYKIDNPKYRP